MESPKFAQSNNERDSFEERAQKIEEGIKELTLEMVGDVFRKARETTGAERLDHVRSLKKFISTISREEYAGLLRHLMTNEATIDELERLGKKELLEETKTKVKKLIPWKK